MSDYARTLGRIAELIADRTEASVAEILRLVRPFSASPELREALDKPAPVPAPEIEESQL